MLFVGFSENTCLLLAFLIYSFTFTLMVSGLDTVAPSVLIQEPETVSSNNGMFTLGFFRPQNSTRCYLGIWFMSESFVVWVANENDPLTDSSGILTISGNGNLVVLNGQKQVVWSTNVSTASNSSAQLLDSGNLVLIDRTTGAFLWQSFQHPSNTLLEGMKLSTNKKTGKKMLLTSWKSTSDPSYGGFSLSLEPHNVTEMFVWKENHPYWRSGPWDGTAFLGIPWMTQSIFQNGVQIKEEEGIYNISYDQTNKAILVTIILDSQGIVKPMIWNSKANIWEPQRKGFHSECDVYGICGPSGICSKRGSPPICSCLKGFEPKNKEEWARRNWTSGCMRREALQCERDKYGSQASKPDGYFKLEKIKPPDHAELLLSISGDIIDCQIMCLKNCSCIAYAYERRIGCMVWNEDLLDLQIFPFRGVDLCIRLAHSELGIDRRKMTAAILISVLIGIVLITAFGYFLWKKVSKQKGEMHLQIHNSKRMRNLKQVKIQDLSLFDFRKLATATNNFDIANKLGQGGFGPVYKGKFEDGQEIAIKRLSRSSGQGVEEFINEVELISKLEHQNLVTLLGCCIEGEEVILVYEFMPNKSLDEHIFDPLQQKSLDWGKRCNIIEGIARGLLYLHRDSRLRIIHRDLKASNILLDEKLNPKISDFGLAKLFGGDEDQANTKRIVGTYGYISPEYATEGLYSEKSDVFSFGILLLEVITGRKNTSFYEDAESLTLLGFAWKLWLDGNVIRLIDPKIYDASFEKDLLRCIHIGLLCVQELAKDRPTMASVMSMLQSDIVDISPPSQPAFILRQTMSCTAEQTPNNDALCSINNVTISKFEGR
ncbi:G-type lectin S-receptor-like serine/threonine-protein kinase At1g11330 isoform X2 [Neltuma alba]|uniref:G-type lectin S-receptor-like serine/threonine-protein kinase At1g11330 isoform X2 n=1 Tax=Neltuma alba TaxID=207710 RepID=UPI0010A3A047|nr:G-type lectin S-receptor-like serine/threonine-protein kinase At1g11330 isoform X2 [Prosopis alba]